MNRNEDPAQTVARELLEELSIVVRVERIVAVETPFRNHLDLAYLCHTTDAVGKLSKELLSYQWVEVDKMPYILKFHYLAIQQAYHYHMLMESR